MLCCRLCGQPDKLGRLIAPCQCAKRDDTLLCHSRCLLQHIQNSLQHSIDASQQEAATCPACRKPYQLKLRWRLRITAHKALSAFSLDQYCHLLGLTLMLVLLLLTAWFSIHPQHPHPPVPAPGQPLPSSSGPGGRAGRSSSGQAHVWVVLIVVAVVVCCGVAMSQVVLRLRLHQTRVELAEDSPV